MADKKPEPEFVAQQLRKPTGDFAYKIAEVMDQVNAPLFDLSLQTMRLGAGDSVLEIGFGSGKFFNKLFEKTEHQNVCGLDYSPEMVASAKSINQSSVDDNKLTLKQGNSDDIPFADQSFDKIYCNMVVYFWDQPEKHLEEVQRVLKPGGKFYTGIRSKESMQTLPFVEFGFNLYTKEQWISILNENGFEVSRIAEKLDPESEVEGQSMRMKSICIVAEKQQLNTYSS